VTPRDRARVDQARAGFREALTKACSCDDCPTDEQIRAVLALSDEQMLQVLQDAR